MLRQLSFRVLIQHVNGELVLSVFDGSGQVGDSLNKVSKVGVFSVHALHSHLSLKLGEMAFVIAWCLRGRQADLRLLV